MIRSVFFSRLPINIPTLSFLTYSDVVCDVGNRAFLDDFTVSIIMYCLATGMYVCIHGLQSEVVPCISSSAVCEVVLVHVRMIVPSQGSDPCSFSQEGRQRNGCYGEV